MPDKRAHHRAPWTPQEDADLLRRCGDGELLPDMSRVFARSQESLRSRCNLLGCAARSSVGRGRRRLDPNPPG